MSKNIIIVGTGFSGAYIGRNLADLGWQVHFIEQRNHIAGNMYDKIDKNTGCLVHEYGPHIFHTDDEDIWKWLNKYSKFTEFSLSTQVYFENYKDWFTCSFGFHTIEQLFDEEKAKTIINKLKKYYHGKEKVTIPELMENEDPLIREFVNILWEEDYKPYTAKQWGIKLSEVDPDILKRVPVYMSYFNKIHNNKYEALPAEGYTKMFEIILNHKNINITLGVNALDKIELKDNKVYYDNQETLLVFTGAIDELFKYKFGYLGYRSLRFEKEIIENDKNAKFGTPCVDIYPNEKYLFTRITNYGLLPLQNHLDYQISVKEYSLKFEPNKGIERYYPLSTTADKDKLALYKNEINKYNGLYLSGRLADYKYYDMDKALIAAREMLGKILKENN